MNNNKKKKKKSIVEKMKIERTNNESKLCAIENEMSFSPFRFVIELRIH